NAPERVDLVAHREFFDMRIGRLARFYVDALRRTRGRAQKTRGTSHRGIFAQREAMAAAKIVGITLALLRILSRRGRVNPFLHAEQMGGMQREVADKVVVGDRKTS